MKKIIAACMFVALSGPAFAQAQQPPQSAPSVAPQAGKYPGSYVMPAGTMLVVTASQEISSKHIEVGQQHRFQVVNDIVEGGKVVIPRGSPVTATVSWKTGRAVGGKSGKFELTFDSVSVRGRPYGLTGQHRQEGRGNSVGALLGSMVISGRSAVMLPGQLVNVFTSEPVLSW